MRVSDQTVYRNTLSWVQNDREDLVRAQEQLSTGKQINRPSDDPVGYARVLGDREVMSFYQQAASQIERAISVQTSMDQALAQVQQLILKARDIATQELQGTEDPMRTQVNLRALNEIMQGLLDAANTSIAGNYVFAGFKNQAPPFRSTIQPVRAKQGYPQYEGSVEYSGDENPLELEVLPGIYAGISFPGDAVFGGTESQRGVNLFALMQDLMNAIAFPDRRVIGGPGVSNKERIKNATLYLNTAYNQVATFRAQIGVRGQSLQNAKAWLDELNLNTNNLRALTENGDVEVQSPLKLDQSRRALEATFASLNTVLQPSVIRLANASS